LLWSCGATFLQIKRAQEGQKLAAKASDVAESSGADKTTGGDDEDPKVYNGALSEELF
jgi:hypothetical protein